MKKDKEIIMNLKLKERERIHEKKNKEDKDFRNITLQILVFMGVIYTIAFSNYSIPSMQIIVDIIIILLAPSCCLGIIIFALTSISKQNYMQEYISGIEKSINRELKKKDRIVFYEKWNSERGYESKDKIKWIYIWDLILPLVAGACVVLIIAITRYKMCLIDNILLVLLIFMLIVTIVVIIIIIKNNKKDF